MSSGHEEHIHPEPTGFWKKYVFSIDHKVIGKWYFFTALFFLFFGGFLALLIRWQLAYPNQPFPVLGQAFAGSLLFDSSGSISMKAYPQIFSMHGLIMIFFVIIPILVGAFGNFLIPLHIGARDVAFPVLNAMSYWVFLAASILVVAAFFVPGGPPGAGWTLYPPLSDISIAAQGSGMGMNLALGGIILLGFSSIMGGLNFLVTIAKMRAPGMTWSRLPLVTWAQFVTAVFQTLATPVLAAALSILLVGRLFDMPFFRPAGLQFEDNPVSFAGGGHPLMWQHLFWFYSHPAVYILVLPGMGVASDLIATFARKPIFGYKAMVISLITIMGLGFIVWGHHMFVSGMGKAMERFFMISTMFIALPSGVKVFNWLATLWRANIRFTTPMLFALSFVSMFIIGGLSGLFMASTPVDRHIHD
ncbi:cbb3-type cytochrome c oxidase subunit I, partial [Candidatus Peregrinibacteria bacterium]|nr:cbb3-type cytochrome c oxidase subunit I [Candidatus Peregrinibacteria bacterium]